MREQTASKETIYFPLIAKNPTQLESRSVLSADGTNQFPSSPPGGVLCRYSEREMWHLEQVTILRGHQTIWKTIETALALLQESQRDLKRLMRSDSDDADWLPTPDRKKIREPHLLLQLVIAAQVNGLETGFSDFTCEECGKRFALRTALDRDRQANLPLLVFGFSEAICYLREGRVNCPFCCEAIVPSFCWS